AIASARHSIHFHSLPSRPTSQIPKMASTQPPVSAPEQSKIKPQDVGWQFVPQYYNFVNSQPHRLHCFYNKRSTFIHGEEGEDVTPAFGQQEIHDRILQIGYNQCKVYIHSMDSQSSADGGIIILVLGELSNNHQSWRKFSQTFFLAEQPGGYFVLNDIFRYLREDVDEDESAPQGTTQPQEEPAQPEVAAEKLPEATTITQEPAKDPVPEPEPVSAPSEVVADAVPEEAEIAAVPDKDVAPEQESPAVKEPEAAAEPAEATPKPAASVTESVASPAPAAPTPAAKAASPAPAAKVASPAPAAPKAAAPATNGSSPASTTPAAPPKPMTWASMAASNVWGKTASPSATSAPAPAPAAAAAPAPPAAPAPGPAQPKKDEKPASAPVTGQGQRRQQTIDPSKVQTAHCFVKLPNWSPDSQSSSDFLTDAELSKIASRFGEVKSTEIVKSKACAFVEFARVESARKAIQHSLPVEQGGEGGTKFPNGTLSFEPRKEKDDRPKAKGQRTGGQQGQGQGQRQVNGGAGGRGGRGPRGRGGQGNQGDRQPQK
ncbi:RAN protein binding protein, partial [Cryptococcus neoformans var. grubii Br795]